MSVLSRFSATIAFPHCIDATYAAFLLIILVSDLIYIYNTIHMYSGITSGRVLNGELLYTKILEVNLFAFAYRLFRRDFSPLDGTYCNMSRRVGRNLYETVCRQMQTN